MNQKILFVDDEPNVLRGIQRTLRKKFEVTTAEGPLAGLERVDEEGPFAVVVSDMRMPEMNGAQFLTRVRERTPESVRMVLSGESELSAAVDAVNEGSIFRYLRKPCSAADLTLGLELALEQHRLITAERELLDSTLQRAVGVLVDILGVSNPEAFARARRIEATVDSLIDGLPIENNWELRLASKLSQLGCVSLGPDTMEKLNRGKPLSEPERRMVASHPEVASGLLAKIPRLDRVARMVGGQGSVVTPGSLSDDVSSWDEEVLASQLVRTAVEFDRNRQAGGTPDEAIERLKAAGTFPAPLVEALAATRSDGPTLVPRNLSVLDLSVGMTFDADVQAENGLLLARQGQEVTDVMIAQLRNFAKGVGIKEPIAVLVPSDSG